MPRSTVDPEGFAKEKAEEKRLATLPPNHPDVIAFREVQRNEWQREKTELDAKRHAWLVARFPWFDGSGYAWGRLYGRLSLKYGKPLEYFDSEISALAFFGLLEELRETCDPTRPDTKSDKSKNSKKKTKPRSMNIAAIDCCRLFKADKLGLPMKTIVEDYVQEHGGSTESIMRTLSDNPDQWKGDRKPT
jgi:hypothetical protein